MESEDVAAIELRAMRSAWRALTRSWELSRVECRALLPMGGEDEEGPPQDTETRMRILIEIGYRIGMPEDMLREWLRRPSRTLGWLTPLDAMSGSRGELRGVRALVEQGFAS